MGGKEPGTKMHLPKLENAAFTDFGEGAISLGKTSQRKGRAGELELARILQAHGYPVEPGRALSYGEVHFS